MSIESETAWLLRVEGLNVQVAGKSLLQNLCFSLARGESICVLGENGTGKTSLLKLIAAAGTPHAKESKVHRSSVIFKNVPGTRPSQIECSWLPQDLARVQNLSVGGFLDLWPRGENHTNKHIAAADMFEVLNLMPRQITTLSGGEWKRVQLHKLWLAQRRILLLDEPTAGLDLRFVSLVKTAVEERCAYGDGVIFSTHDLAFAFSLAHKFLYFCGETCRFLSRAEFVNEVGKDSIFSVPVSWHGHAIGSRNLSGGPAIIPLVHY